MERPVCFGAVGFEGLAVIDFQKVERLTTTPCRTIVPGPAGSTVKLGFQSDYGQRMEAPLKRTTGKFSRNLQTPRNVLRSLKFLTADANSARGTRAANPVFGRPDLAADSESPTSFCSHALPSRLPSPEAWTVCAYCTASQSPR